MSALGRGVSAAAVPLCMVLACGCCAFDSVSRAQADALHAVARVRDSGFPESLCAVDERDPPAREIVLERSLAPQLQEDDGWCWAAALSISASYHGISYSQSSIAPLAYSYGGAGCSPPDGSIDLSRLRMLTALPPVADRVITVSWLDRSTTGRDLAEHLGYGPAIWLRRTTSTRDGHAYVIYGGKFVVRANDVAVESLYAFDPSDGLEYRVSCAEFTTETLSVAVVREESEAAVRQRVEARRRLSSFR